MTLNDLLNNVNKNLTYYEVIMTKKALGEDGKYVESDEYVGYGLLNMASGVLEHTSTMLPGVLWQATHFENTLKSLLSQEDDTPHLATVDDIIPPTMQ